MVKNIILSILTLLLGAFSSLQAQTSVKPTNQTEAKPAFKFIEDISINAEEDALPVFSGGVPSVKADLLKAAKSAGGNIEAAGELQFKYSLLLDVEVEMIRNINLFRFIDDWYGTHYLFGGTTKKGIDCSAMMQVLFASLYGVSLPRTARQQYDFTRRISRTELKEGDLLFFNTRGGVSHVGMYLQNNKFVHASSAYGVTVSDMFDPYYSKRLIGAGRINEERTIAAANLSPKP